jgi:hypothetical protein
MRLSLPPLMSAILCVFVLLCLAPCSSFGQTPKLTTFPSPPPANQPFDGELSILANSESIGPTPPSPGSAGEGYIGFWFSDCGSGCLSGKTEYRTFSLHFPSFEAGTYRVEFNPISDVDPLLPPVAVFSLTIGAVTSSVPTMSVPASIVVASLLMGLAWRRLQNHMLGVEV